MSLYSDLIQFGFPPNEAKVYKTLLDLKSCTAAPLIKKTGLHRNVVYTALDHLIVRKIVAEKKIKGKKTFSLVDPNILYEEANKNASLAKSIAQKVESLIEKGKQEITVHEGNEEYLNLLTGILNSLPKGSTKYVLGTGGETFMKNTMRPIWDAYHEVAKKQKIRIKMVAYEPQRPSFEPETEKEKIYTVKYLPTDAENPAGIHIYPEIGVILNIIYSDDLTPVTAIKIKNEKLTSGYLKLFENLWKSAS